MFSLLWELCVYLDLVKNFYVLIRMSQVLLNKNSAGSVAGSPSRRLLNYYGADVAVDKRVRTQYQLAIRQYLNRRFDSAWEMVAPTMEKLLGADPKYARVNRKLKEKYYKLYLGLLDLLLKEEGDGSGLAGSYARLDDLHDQFMNGLIPRQLQQLFGAAAGDAAAGDAASAAAARGAGTVDPELALMSFVVQLNNGYPQDKLKAQVQDYLETTGVLHGQGLDNDKLVAVLEFYCDRLLVEMGQVDEARDVLCKVYVMDDDELARQLARLDEAVTTQRKSRNGVSQRQTQTQSQSQSQSQSQRPSVKPSTHAPANTALSDDAAPPAATSTPSSETGLIELDPAPAPAESVPAVSRIQRETSDTPRKFGHALYKPYLDQLQGYLDAWLGKGLARSLAQMVKPATAVIFLVSLLLSLRKMQPTAMRQRLIWLLQKLRNTVTMAMKVTYL